MAASARGFIVSHFTDLSIKSRLPPQPPPAPPPPLPSSFSSSSLFSRHHNLAIQRRRFSSTPGTTVSCLISGVDGGGVSDEFVSTRKSGFDRGFSVIANMLRRIEPLDTSVISKGVSDHAKDSMKQTISSMLGLLPSDQFSVTVNVSKSPLHHLLVSSIITGYTLWNAEYRISLMRNFDMSPASSSNLSNKRRQEEVSAIEESKGSACDVGFDMTLEDLNAKKPQIFSDLPPEALNYIQRLQSELSSAKEELNACKQENMQMEYSREDRNNLLEYLRSLDSDMVTELSRPSSLEVEEIINQLVQNILQRFFKEDTGPRFLRNSGLGNSSISENHPDRDAKFHDDIGFSRDYLAKLIFWCMVLGHHLRGLENRLHLSCVVGLL